MRNKMGFQNYDLKKINDGYYLPFVSLVTFAYYLALSVVRHERKETKQKPLSARKPMKLT